LTTRKLSIAVKLGEHKAEAVRYAAYAVSGSAYVHISPAKGGLRVAIEPKPGCGPAPALAAAFRRELEDEELRARVSAENRELREFLLLKAVNYRPAPPPQDDSGLTPQQEKELNDLIAQIENEIRTEAPGSDPLGITSTWEDRYESKKRSRKAR